jgi:hypothetical protein
MTNNGGIILKKSTSLLLSGILVSGMVLGTVVTPATVVNAAPATTQAAETVTNTVGYIDTEGNTIEDFNNQISGTKGEKITSAPDGYVVADSSEATFGADGSNKTVTVTPLTTVTVNFVDQNNNLVSSQNVDGGIGNVVELTNLPAGCSWNNDAEKTIKIAENEQYNIPVTKKVSNTVIFKTSDNTEVGRTQIFGEKAGDSVTLDKDQLPEGYTVSDDTLTLQNEGNTQFVTVTKNAADGIMPIKGVVRVNVELAHLYDKDGKVLSRSLSNQTRWQTNNKMVLNGVTYYQVSTTEWLKASDIIVENEKGSEDANTDTNTNKDATKADRSVVETKNSGLAHLYDDNGELIASRSLSPNTRWATDLMKTTNGVKMYRVATHEWLKVSEIK